MKANTRKALVFAAVAVVLCFIWGNSMLPGEESGEISGGLLLWLKAHFAFLQAMPEVVLRKLGHFSEFMALGFFLCWLFRLNGQVGLHRLTVPLFFGILAANIDETIQVFRPDRGPSVIDVWIDVAGVCVGIGLFRLAFRLHRKRTLKGNKE